MGKIEEMPRRYLNADALKRSRGTVRRFMKEANRMAPYSLEKVGRTLVNFCKDHAFYTDRTSNLRNSISHVILRPRKSEKVKPPEGEAFDVTNDGKDVVLVIFAGMEYGAPVEALKGFWVISGSIAEARRQQRTIKGGMKLKFRKIK